MINNDRLVLFLIFILSCSHTGFSQSNNQVTIPFEFVEDFEHGHINGWETYPPFQDSAFDPELKITTKNNMPGSKYALTRKDQIGFESEYEMGFIRKIRFVVTGSSQFSFDYHLQTCGDARQLEVALLAVNGQKYTWNRNNPVEGDWQHEVNIPVNEFTNNQNQSPPPGVLLEGVYVLAHIKKTNPDVGYRIYIDNLRISGAEPADFRISKPRSTVLEHWHQPVLLQHFQPGDTLALTVAAPEPVVLAAVQFTLHDPRGNIILKEQSIAKNSHPYWINHSIYTFKEHDLRGKWRGVLTGQDNKNRTMKTAFDIWLTNKNHPHPRLYFGDDDLAYYQKRTADSTWTTWFDSLKARTARLRRSSDLGSINFGAETSSITKIPSTKWTLKSMEKVDLSVYDKEYLLPTLRHYFNRMVPAMEILQGNALVYWLTGAKEAGYYAKEALIRITNWNTWTHPWFTARHQESYYPVGELGVRAAFCYDIVYDLLSPEERVSVQQGMLRNCIVPIYKEYVEENRIPSGTSNWIGNSVSGALSCAMAIYGDNPELQLEPYITGLLTKLQEHIYSTLDTSGAWGEGIGYQGFAYTNVLPTITALRRVLNIDLTTPALLRSYLYTLYNFSDPEILDVGDSHPNPTTLSYFGWISSQTDDPVFRWLYRHGPRQHFLDFIFGKAEGAVSPPDALPMSKLFPALGAAIFRSGWSPDDILLNFRCGPFYNHQHFDQGSFQLRAFGETLVPEAGWAHYYNDPRYRLYYIQPIGHNTVLLDNNPGSQRSGDYLRFIKAVQEHAAMQQFIAAKHYAAATGELSKLYRGKLSLFERNMVFMQSQYFLVFDRLRSSGGKHEYDWLLHFNEKDSVQVTGNRFRFNGDKAALCGQVLAPADAEITIEEGPTVLNVPITQPGFIKVKSPLKSTGEDFLVVLNPQDNKSGLDNLSKKVTRLQGDNFLGVKMDRGKEIDVILFRREEAGADIAHNGINSDGRIIAVTYAEDGPKTVAVHDATRASISEIGQIENAVTFTAVVDFKTDISEWQIQAEAAGAFSFTINKKPQQVVVNRQKLESAQYDEKNKRLTINLLAGENEVIIKP